MPLRIASTLMSEQAPVATCSDNARGTTFCCGTCRKLLPHGAHIDMATGGKCPNENCMLILTQNQILEGLSRLVWCIAQHCLLNMHWLTMRLMCATPVIPTTIEQHAQLVHPALLPVLRFAVTVERMELPPRPTCGDPFNLYGASSSRLLLYERKSSK